MVKNENVQSGKKNISAYEKKKYIYMRKFRGEPARKPRQSDTSNSSQLFGHVTV